MVKFGLNRTKISWNLCKNHYIFSIIILYYGKKRPHIGQFYKKRQNINTIAKLNLHQPSSTQSHWLRQPITEVPLTEVGSAKSCVPLVWLILLNILCVRRMLLTTSSIQDHACSDVSAASNCSHARNSGLSRHLKRNFIFNF